MNTFLSVLVGYLIISGILWLAKDWITRRIPDNDYSTLETVILIGYVIWTIPIWFVLNSFDTWEETHKDVS